MTSKVFSGVGGLKMGQPVVMTFPKSRCESLLGYVLEPSAYSWPNIILTAPLRDGEATAAVKGEHLVMRWNSEGGEHLLVGRVGGFVKGPPPTWQIEAEKVDVTNRRRHFRVPTEGHGILVAIEGMTNPAELLDISESGIRCLLSRITTMDSSCGSQGRRAERREEGCQAIQHAIQEDLSLTASIDVHSDRLLSLRGDVVRVMTRDPGVEFSIAFEALSENDGRLAVLRRHVLTLERERLRCGRV